MSWLRVARHRLRAIFRPGAVNREVEEEMQLHIELQTEANIRAGMAPDEARRRARLSFGGMEGHKEESRRAQGLELMGIRASWLDFRLGLRMLVKTPGLTVVGVLALMVATGIGAAFFQFTENMFNPRIPLADADRMVAIRNMDLAAARPEARSLFDFGVWREEVRSLDLLAAAQVVEQTVTTEESYSELLEVVRISPAAFEITRVEPLMGRTLGPADERLDAPPAVVIGFPVWQRLFGGDPTVLGRTLQVGTVPATIVGVMPEEYGFPINHSVWVPLTLEGRELVPREGPPIRVYGRLRRGATLEQAQAELAAIGTRLSADLPDTHEQLRPRVVSFREAMIMDPEMLWAIRGARVFFGMLMLVMCVNVATLVFARTVRREGEFAVRSALGASRQRIIGQLFVEGLALTLIAASLGLLGAWLGLRWGMPLFWRVQEEAAGGPFWWNHGLHPTTMVYVLLLAAAGAVMVGVLPALKVTGASVKPSLNQIGSGSPRLRFGGIWTVVVVLQVAISVAFLPAVVLTSRDALRDAERSTGFAADSYLTAQLRRELEVPVAELSAEERSHELARGAALRDEITQRVAVVPGVVGVAFADRISGMNHVMDYLRVEGLPGVDAADPGGQSFSRRLLVDQEFFRVMDARIISGRGFLPEDVVVGRTAIVNERWVQEVAGGRDPVGSRITFSRPEEAGGEGEFWHEIVGVVQDLEMDRYGPGAHRVVYHALRPEDGGAMQMFVRIGPGAITMGPTLRSTIPAIDPSLRVGEMVTVRQVWEPVHTSERFFAAVQAVVALIALLLSMAGVHALMSFTVSQRMREIGVRTALGARPVRIITEIFSRAFAQLGIGVLLGCGIAALVMRDDLATEGPLMLTTVVLTMLVVGLFACLAPALRALRVQPTEALRAGG